MRRNAPLSLDEHDTRTQSSRKAKETNSQTTFDAQREIVGNACAAPLRAFLRMGTQARFLYRMELAGLSKTRGIIVATGTPRSFDTHPTYVATGAV